MLSDTVGVLGLTQQVRARDQKGKTLLMYAARYAGSVEVFSSALGLVNTLTSERGLLGLRARDAKGRTVLHHAAEARREDMLSKVLHYAIAIFQYSFAYARQKI